MIKCVRHAAKRSYACLVVCPESHFSEQLLLSRTAKSCKIFGLRAGLRGLRIRKTAFSDRVQAMYLYSPMRDMTT